VLNARLFGDIIRRMPDDVVSFDADDKQMVRISPAATRILRFWASPRRTIRSCRRWRTTFSVSIQQKVLRDMIEQTAFAVSTNESRPVHTGALFEITGRADHGGGGRLPSGGPPGAAGKD
jgi:DNA polymerase-3 subunit beta